MKVIAKCLAKLTTHFFVFVLFFVLFHGPACAPCLVQGRKAFPSARLGGGGDFKGNERKPPHWSTRIEAAAAANASQQAREDGDFPTEDGEFFFIKGCDFPKLEGDFLKKRWLFFKRGW